MDFKYHNDGLITGGYSPSSNYGTLGKQAEAFQTVGAGQTSAPTNSQIRDGITYLEELVGGLHMTLSGLEGRLDTVLTPIPPSPATPSPIQGQGVNGGPPPSHMNERVRALNLQITEVQLRIYALLSRIEL